jgi:hypothetical protein
MDPNATLHRIRLLLHQHDEASREAVGHQLGALDRLNELAELTRSLDEWLSKGGFPPEAWGSRERFAFGLVPTALDVGYAQARQEIRDEACADLLDEGIIE